jgi:hypothetical protein
MTPVGEARRSAPAWVRARFDDGISLNGGATMPARDGLLSSNVAWTAFLTTALTAFVFVTAGGDALAPNTWAEIVLVLAGAGIMGAAVVLAPQRPAHGAGALALFAALAALTLASVSWSVSPSDSWVEANRTFGYLAAFGAATALARVRPGQWRVLVLGVAATATIVSGYALLVKVFPGSLDPTELVGRLRSPFTYYNAVGLLAAMGLPPCIWAGAQREGRPLLKALAFPAITVLGIALVLCYSRGALIACVLGLAVWFVAVPLRLRGAMTLALGALFGAIGVIWALGSHPITSNNATLAARTSSGHSFGMVLVLLIAFSYAAGVGALYARDRFPVTQALRRRLGTGLVIAVACVPVAALGALAVSHRGFTGQISHIWSELTNSSSSGVSNNASRLTQVSNTRARYWREGVDVGKDHLLVGAGALGYATASERYSPDRLMSVHAHSFIVETFADFGLLGLAASLALLVAWAVASGRALELPPIRRSWLKRPKSESEAAAAGPLTHEQQLERAGLFTLLAVVIVFGAHSTIDWTWFIPGCAVPALLCAAWLAGHGPLRSAPEATCDPGTHGIRDETMPKPKLTQRPEALAGLCALAAIALVAAWSIWQPLRASDANQNALTALSHGKFAVAIADAKDSISINPTSAEPLWDLATIYAADGKARLAHATLIRAVRLQPSNPATWLQLGEYDLSSNRQHEALAVLRAALYLGPHNPETLNALTQAGA